MILTNSHVVRNTCSLRLSRHGQPGTFDGRILCDAPMVDLALVTCDDPVFFEGLEFCTFSTEIPELGANVIAVGYPLGATSVTLTRGVVSNVQLMDLTLAPRLGEEMLVIQIDAAINPGNSGGPVFDAETKQAVGVAFSGRNDGEGQGFIISTLVVNTFLDVYTKTGTYTVPPALGLSFQGLTNLSLSKRVWGESKLNGKLRTSLREGMLVTKVEAVGSSRGLVMAGDVLMAIDGEAISEEVGR